MRRPSKYTSRKLISLGGSVLVSLSSGSNYAVSSFAPQLQEVSVERREDIVQRFEADYEQCTYALFLAAPVVLASHQYPDQHRSSGRQHGRLSQRRSVGPLGR